MVVYYALNTVVLTGATAVKVPSNNAQLLGSLQHTTLATERVQMGKSVTAPTTSLPSYNESKSRIRLCRICRHNVINEHAQSNLYTCSVSLMKSQLTGFPGLRPLHCMRGSLSLVSHPTAGSDIPKSSALMAGHRTADESNTKIRYCP